MGGKKAGGAWGGGGGNEPEELIWAAVTEALQPVMHHEWATDQPKLEKKIRDYFRKGAKNLAFGAKPWYETVDEYADIVFSAIFSGLGEKEWLAEADFLLCLDAGIKDTFPQQILQRVPQNEFERVVLAAHDRAFEEQRILPLLWEAVQGSVEGPKGKKKVYNAVEAAWKECKPSGSPNEAQDFVWQWIDKTIGLLAEVTQGEPQWTLEPQAGEHLFHSIIAAGCLPMALVQAYGQPPAGWPFIGHCIRGAYQAHTVHQPSAKGGGKAFSAFGGKGKGKSKKPRKPNPLLEDLPEDTCRDWVLKGCSRGDTCKFLHDDAVKAEVDLKRDLLAAERAAEAEAEGLDVPADEEEAAVEDEEVPPAKKGRTGF